MGHSTSEPLQVRSLLAQNWLPSDKEPNVFVHRGTHEQAHRHSIRILAKDLPRETALFSTRMSSHQPYICRLLYFHAGCDGRSLQEHEKQFREMLVYTDRFLHLKQWNRQKVVFALHGLRRLISVHGPIRISEHMICQNECGEVKVWVSQNPANNHPDSKYMSEEQSMADFAAVLTKRNQELANILLGCLTLKEASERLNRPYKDQPFPPQSHSHRALASEEGGKKKDTADKTLVTPYKNVFGDSNECVKSKGELLLTPKASAKANENYPQSTFISKEQEFSIQATNSITLGRYRQYMHPPKSGTPNIEEGMSIKCNPKSKINSDTAIDMGRGVDSSYRQNVAQTSIEFNKKTNSNIRPQETAKPFLYQPRFETANNISSPMGSYASQKNKPEVPWVASTESVNLYSTTSYHNRRQAKGGANTKEGSKSGDGMIIINNNVNNFISNVTHNHILKGDKSPQEPVHQFRTHSKKEEHPSCGINPHSSNQFFKTNVKGKEKYTIPNFLQQKKKPTSQWMEEAPPLVNKCKSNINLVKKDTVSSNPQESPSDSPYLASHNYIDDDSNKKQTKVFNFAKSNDPTSSCHKSPTPTFSFNNLYPRTPPPASPQNFSSFQKGFGNFEFKMPLRTKTTEFYHKAKDVGKKDEIQNKSFTQHELEKSIYEQKQAEEQEKKDILPKEPPKQQPAKKPEPTSAESTPEPEAETGKLEFKKQLRNEFKFLLGMGEGKQKQEQSTRTTLNSRQDEGETKEVHLKDKIIRKQTAFAQLKKQALKVLTDD